MLIEPRNAFQLLLVVGAFAKGQGVLCFSGKRKIWYHSLREVTVIDFTGDRARVLKRGCAVPTFVFEAR